MFTPVADFYTQIAAGRCGGFPTDTVPGVGALPEAAQQIYTLKGREPGKPLILLAASLDQIRPLCQGWLTAWTTVMEQHWPGGLTLVLPAAARVPVWCQQAGGVGLRIPNHPVALALLAQVGPLATTSINRSGHPPLTDPAQIQAEFPQLPLLAGEYRAGQPSTVARWREESWEVLRQGQIKL